MAYVVGLISTDGCLVNTGRHVSFVSEDLQLMETFLDCLGRGRRFRTEITPKGTTLYRVQMGDVGLYRWLETIGLMQRKSLLIGSIEVPDEFMLPLVRGLLDGDGTIINKVYRADTKDRSDYYWEYLQTKFVSGSRAHLDWLRERLARTLRLVGYLQGVRSGFGDRTGIAYELRYGKRESLTLLPALYADPIAPRLMRKWLIWDAYAERHRIPRP